MAQQVEQLAVCLKTRLTTPEPTRGESKSTKKVKRKKNTTKVTLIRENRKKHEREGSKDGWAAQSIS